MLSDWLYQSALPGETTVEFIVKQPWVMWLILSNYVYFVKRCGPAWMKSREPFNLRQIIIFYNTFQIFFCMYVCHYCYTAIVEQTGFILNCIDTGDITKKAHYVLIYSKYTDLIETCFFVLRKKNSQVSFLHVYHHVVVILIPTYALYISPGGMPMFYGFVNAIVHVIMYLYYLLTNLYPEKRELITRLKPRITEIQLLQFFVLTLHFLRTFTGLCDTSKLISFLGLTQNAAFCYLFSSFYSRTYLKKKEKQRVD